MANGVMKYENEREDSDFTLSGTQHVYTFAETYSVIPKVIIDGYSGSKPTVVVAIDKVTITGADGDTGHLTVISKT